MRESDPHAKSFSSESSKENSQATRRAASNFYGVAVFQTEDRRWDFREMSFKMLGLVNNRTWTHMALPSNDGGL